MESPETPITIQTPSSLAAEETADRVVCKFCRRQFAKYNCPNCNVPYCSLPCYRNEAHSQCSEGFYKKEIELGINSEPSKSAQERAQMLEVLKRFEEESAENEDTVGGDEDEDGLSQRFANLDLESVSADTLWSMLTPKEREKFLQAVNDPSSEVAQQLLSSDELRKNLREPWWKVSNLPNDPTLPRNQVQAEPTMIDIPNSMLKPIPNRPLLVYNIVSISVCYAFTIRHLGVASFSRKLCDLSDLEEALSLVSRLVPFLVDRKSTLVHTNLTGVITDLWSRFDKNTVTPGLMSTLLRDAAYLMSPSSIIEAEEDKVQSSGSGRVELTLHPHRRPLLVLSDLFELISLGLEKRWVPQQSKHVSHKLVFYAAHVATMPTPLLRSVATELEQRGEEYHREAKMRDADAQSDNEHGPRKVTGRLVEEL